MTMQACWKHQRWRLEERDNLILSSTGRLARVLEQQVVFGVERE
jgi:hypothetical protein